MGALKLHPSKSDWLALGELFRELNCEHPLDDMQIVLDVSEDLAFGADKFRQVHCWDGLYDLQRGWQISGMPSDRVEKKRCAASDLRWETIEIRVNGFRWFRREDKHLLRHVDQLDISIGIVKSGVNLPERLKRQIERFSDVDQDRRQPKRRNPCSGLSAFSSVPAISPPKEDGPGNCKDGPYRLNPRGERRRIIFPTDGEQHTRDDRADKCTAEDLVVSVHSENLAHFIFRTVNASAGGAIA